MWHLLVELALIIDMHPVKLIVIFMKSNNLEKQTKFSVAEERNS